MDVMHLNGVKKYTFWGVQFKLERNMEYGNTSIHLKSSIQTGIGLAVVLFVVFISVALHQGTFVTKNYLVLFGGPLFIGSIVPLVVLTTLISRLRIENGIVQSVLFGKWVHKEAELSQLTTVEISNFKSSAVIMHFSNGVTIRLGGAHMEVIKRLMNDLKSSAPNVTFVIPPIFKHIYENWL